MAAKDTYTEAVGRRKSASARVRLVKGKQESIVVNEKSASDYFRSDDMVDMARKPLGNISDKYAITTKVSGGGLKAQAQAVQHGIARALVKIDEELRKELKQSGFLKRDPRAKERKKFGLRKARRAPQWSKR